MSMENLKLTEQEKELIEAIRNLKKSKHNYSIQFEFYIRELFERLISDEED